MGEKPTKKPLIIGIIVAAVAVAVLVTGIVLTNNTKNSADTAAVTASELSNAADYSISYGDYDGMQKLSKSIQNGELTGKIVKVDGLVNQPGLSYSIVEASSDGTTKIGTVFKIQDSDGYPDDGTHITITAKVVEAEPLVFYLYTLKDFIITQ